MKRILILLIILAFSACGKNPTPDEGKAQRLVASFIQALHEQDYEKAFSFVDPNEFFAVHSKPEWQQYFADIHTALGKVDTFRLKNKLNDTRFSGTFFMYEYVSKYEKGLSKELITIVHKINTGDAPLKIFSYKIESSKLEKINQNW